MTLSPLRLAQTLDEWSDEGRTALTETDAKLVANGLSAEDAALLASMCGQLAWATELQDGSGAPIGADSVHPDFGPFSAVIDKPVELARPGRLVTNFALAYELTHREPSGTFQLVRCVDPFETAMLRSAPVGDETPFEPKPVAASPRRLVREGSDRRVVAREIGHWLIRDRDGMPYADPAFRTWAPLAGAALMRALANEVEQESLVFRGPPLVRVALSQADEPDLTVEEFKALQESASWVYESERISDETLTVACSCLGSNVKGKETRQLAMHVHWEQADTFQALGSLVRQALSACDKDDEEA